MKKNIDMLHGGVAGSLVRFAIPLVLTGWLQMLFNSADSLVVGRFAGANALGAVGATFPFVMLVISFFGGLAAGVTVCASNDVGAADHESFRETLHVSVLLAVIVGCFVTLLGESIARPVLRMMNAPEDIIDGSTIYLRIFFLCMPAQMVYNTCASVMRARGDSRKPLFFLAISGVANVLMNIIFVAVFHWNVVGVAVATAITQYLSAFLAVTALMREEEPWRLNLRKLCLRKDKIARILKIGVPAGLQVSMLAASDIPLQTAVNSLGSLAVSGNAAATNIEGIVFSTIESVVQACTVFTGQCVGARMFDRTKKVLVSSMGIALACGVILGVVAFLLRYRIISMFLPDNTEAVAYGADRAAAVVSFLFVYSVMGTLNGSLRGYGISLTPALINIVALFGFRFSWAKFYFPHHQSLFHLYISYPLAWSIAIILLLIIYRPSLRRAKEKLGAPQQQ
ncbi:MAG: MATE family efflux transporter [Oscillospiraceae bacterium]|nr:MATE family efflux transporter [Oscillospiraceae bacterium]